MIGQTLGRYRVVTRIGAGGMGVVYGAHDERLDRAVAIKVLSPSALADQAARSRFRREALALSKLNHPAIATIFDFDTDKNVDFLVMELVDGPTVGTTAHCAMQEDEVVRLGLQLADGLAAAHAAGVIHRDLKPGNLRLTPDGRLKILDFGLARLLQPNDAATVTATGSLHAGTLAYMAPEQLSGEADARTDIYAAGAILYELSTGHRLFPDTNGVALVNAIANRPVVPPREANPELSTDLERIILKAIDKDPGRRYQSAAELRVDLARLESGSSAVAAAGTPQRHRRTNTIYATVIAALLVAVVGAFTVPGIRGRWSATPAPARIKSLAVLPLANLSGDPEQDYFADGMTDALITDLGKIGELRVISRTSAMQYKDPKKSLPDIARALRVDAIVEGTVLRSGDRVRISAQLIHAPTEQHLWAETYERNVRDVLELQRDVADAIAREIRAKVAPRDKAAPPPHRTDPAAYEAYLKAQYFFNKRSEATMRRSIELFSDAIERDPTMAMAYAGLADAYGMLAYAGYSVLAPHDGMPQAKTAAEHALALDPNSAASHAILAWITQNYDWDRDGAERGYRRAIELNPNYARVHQNYAWLLAAVGRHDEARREIERARDLDPLSLIINHNVGWMAWYARDFDRAVVAYRRTLDLDANFANAHQSLGQALVMMGQPAAGMAELEKAIQLAGRGTVAVGSLGYARARAGDRHGAEAIVRELLDRAKERHVPGYWVAVAYAGLGKRDQVFAWLDRAFADREGILVTLNVDPFFDRVRDDPRFERLIARIGFVQSVK